MRASPGGSLSGKYGGRAKPRNAGVQKIFPAVTNAPAHGQASGPGGGSDDPGEPVNPACEASPTGRPPQAAGRRSRPSQTRRD